MHLAEIPTLNTQFSVIPQKTKNTPYASPSFSYQDSLRRSRQGRSTNGTLTFRRTSTTPSSQTSSQMQASTESIHSTIADPTVISAMPVGSTNVESSTNPPRYSRDQLLSVFASQQQPNTNQTDVTSLFLPGWNPGHVNGTSTRGWGKSADTHPAPQEPDLCWDSTGSVKPVGLQEMSSEEKEVGTSLPIFAIQKCT